MELRVLEVVDEVEVPEELGVLEEDEDEGVDDEGVEDEGVLEEVEDSAVVLVLSVDELTAVELPEVVLVDSEGVLVDSVVLDKSKREASSNVVNGSMVALEPELAVVVLELCTELLSSLEDFIGPAETNCW